MILMIVFLLVLNFVLAAGLIIIWLQSHAWSEKTAEAQGRVQGTMHDLEARIAHMEKKAQSQDTDSEWPKDWFSNPLPEGRNQVPERYRLAIKMADNGLDHHLSQALGVSRYEAEQLANLARLAQQSTYQEGLNQTHSKDFDPE